MADGVVRLFERNLKKLSSPKGKLIYNVADLQKWVDGLTDLTCLTKIVGSSKFLSFFVFIMIIIYTTSVYGANSMVPSNVVGAAIATSPNAFVYSGAGSTFDRISQIHYQECLFIIGDDLNTISGTDGQEWMKVSLPMQLTYSNTTQMGTVGYLKRSDIYILNTDKTKITSSSNLLEICPTMSDYSTLITVADGASKLIIVKSKSSQLFKKKCNDQTNGGCTKSDIISEVSFGTILKRQSSESSNDGWVAVFIIRGNGSLSSSQSYDSLQESAYINESETKTFEESIRSLISVTLRPLADASDWTLHAISQFGSSMIGGKYLKGGRTSMNVDYMESTGFDAAGIVQLLYLVSYCKRIPRTMTDIFNAADTEISINGFHVGDLIFLKSNTIVTNVMVYAGKEASGNGNEFIIEATESGIRLMTVKDRLGLSSVRDMTKGASVLNNQYTIYWGSYFERSVQDQKQIIEILLYVFVLGTIALACGFFAVKHIYKRIKIHFKGYKKQTI
ncbi:predicted protein [Naegleria gruberi]|uniref:Predicted protein n=1 Tax=Naegleria gruberi TaxID=5762 RepID=D2VM66_NAEGR|nr:uncharacterized protein NAEGRDRAFT_58650 [Naegleria gruberi]EFC42011.1 predicted protein [Naegleria gruberi]|eukprot:XP_002674755.1 predicted protein [Naegleria gruberi strain NEG-M]